MKKLFLTILLIVNLSLSQNCYDVLRPFWGFSNTQITSNSLGSATVASGYLAPGLTSNPANYAFNKFSFFQINYSNNEFNSSSSTIGNSGINGFDIVLPMSVYRGNFSISIGKHDYIDYLAASNSDLFNFSEEGGLSSYHIGAAVEFSKNTFLGFDIKFLGGQNKMIEFSDSANYIFHPKFDGTEVTLGILHRQSKLVQFGLSIDLSTTISIRDKVTLNDYINEEESFSDTWYYDAKKPSTLHAGFGLFFDNFNLLYEYEYTDWSSLKIHSGNMYQDDILYINNQIRETFKPVNSHHLGMAYHFKKIPIHLFGGYQYLPVPFDNQYGNNIRQSYSYGISFMIQPNISIQTSYNKYEWDYEGSPESYEKISFGISLHSLNL